MGSENVRVIGLTGGTGSGKSTVSRIAGELGAGVIDADMIAREIVQKGQEALQKIVEAFGNDILLASGELNRKKLGGIVFADREKLKLLNQITHTYIVERIKQDIEWKRAKQAYTSIIVDAAVLVESGLYKICDRVWVVVADRGERLERIMKRDSLSRHEAENRINAQLPEEEMKKYASAVIYNVKDIAFLRMQVVELMR